MFKWLGGGMVATGTAILGITFVFVRQLINELPSGVLRKRWHLMGGLILLFITGYLGYLSLSWERFTGWHEMVVPVIFFFGANFVWLAISSALFTVKDLRRVALLEQEAIVDPLTGIYNRRHLDRRLEEECAKAKRYETKLSVLMLDIDHFKRINDSYGHKAGDEVLSHVGKLILNTIRDGDIATRYGGEEFSIIAPNLSAVEAMLFGERIRKYIETHPLTISGEQFQRQEISVTVSIGVSDLRQDVTEGDVLIRRADEALYRAKQNGRNRVETYKPGKSVPNLDFNGMADQVHGLVGIPSPTGGDVS